MVLLFPFLRECEPDKYSLSQFQKGREKRRSYCLQQTVYKLNMFFKVGLRALSVLANDPVPILEIAKRTEQCKDGHPLTSLDPGVSRQDLQSTFFCSMCAWKKIENMLILLKTFLNMSLRGNSLSNTAHGILILFSYYFHFMDDFIY